ncbi:MAG: ion channel [Pseudomonadota bacterium]
MLQQLLLGSFIISLTIIVQAVFIVSITSFLERVGTWLVLPPVGPKALAFTIAIVLWLLAGITVNTWIWVGIFLWYDAFDALEPALYFAIVTFTTLGYGDIAPGEEWRILAALSSVNGIIIFGLNTAFLVEFISRLRQAQEQM